MATKTLDYYVSETYAKFALPSIKYATVQINKRKVSIQLYAYKKFFLRTFSNFTYVKGVVTTRQIKFNLP